VRVCIGQAAPKGIISWRWTEWVTLIWVGPHSWNDALVHA
jgi:hypothetical protein